MKMWQVVVAIPATLAWIGILWWAIFKPLLPSRQERAIRRDIKIHNELKGILNGKHDT